MKKYLVFLAVALPALLFSLAAGEAKKGVTLSSADTLVMDSEFSDLSVAKIALAAREMDTTLAKGRPIYLVLTTPGGSIEAGLELIDNLNALGRPVHTVTTFSASMGFQTVQGLGRRYITPTGVLMSHKAKGGFSGEFPGQLDSRYQFYLKRLTKLDEKTVSRSGGKLTLASYQALYENEYWCEAQDCVDMGLADEATTVSCDKSLNGTKEVNETVDFMGMKVDLTIVKAACPTITGILDLKIKVDGTDAVMDVDALARDFELTPSQAGELKKVLDDKINEITPTKSNRNVK